MLSTGTLTAPLNLVSLFERSLTDDGASSWMLMNGVYMLGSDELNTAQRWAPERERERETGE